ncbi:MAG TPA: hypothetical protein VHW26_09625 [Solirubrobacteraceae bacterium]|jgi:hypothetical protein|nr:hypothetical protein [Solirubrobacteraceae bacterium]
MTATDTARSLTAHDAAVLAAWSPVGLLWSLRGFAWEPRPGRER